MGTPGVSPRRRPRARFRRRAVEAADLVAVDLAGAEAGHSAAEAVADGPPAVDLAAGTRVAVVVTPVAAAGMEDDDRRVE